MTKFIALSKSMTGLKILVNPNHIEAVTQLAEGSRLYMRSGGVFDVKESMGSIQNIIALIEEEK